MTSPNILSSRDIRFLVSIVRKAGKKAQAIQKKGFEITRKKDTSIVTRADTEVQDFLIRRISSRFPGINLIHEENFDRSVTNIEKDTLSAIIDPVDGTAMFSMYLPFWCVSVGIFRGFEPVYGFVYSPGCDMLFHCDDTSSYCNGRILTVDRELTVDAETNIFYASEVPRLYTLSSPGKIRNLGSTALHACLISDNRRNRALTFIGSGYLWDWAGAIPVIKKAGGNVRYLSGEEVDISEVVTNRYRFPQTMVAYSPDDFELVKSLFREREK